MNTVELFCGSKSFSKVAEKQGHTTWTTDIDPKFNPDHVGDILDEKTQKIIYNRIKKADVVWMSPSCTEWSLSAGNKYWTFFRQPRGYRGEEAIKVMMFCRFVADYCAKNGKTFFIENPNGRAVWILDNRYRRRAWYCQYGDSRAKPTNIWTNSGIEFETCSNNSKTCHHERAPRGSKTGTQGLKDSVERAKIPSKLFSYIFKVLEDRK